MAFPDETSGLLAEAKDGDNSPAQSVSELSGALKRTVESAFGHVRVRGEISGWKRHASGHCYFTLKDEGACIDAVIWKGQAGSLAFRPEDGAEVIATGKLTTYAGRSKYQIVVNRMELAGEGALMALLDRRRRALAAEGLFGEERKRALPFLPKVIGVVTSPTGAVIRDILHRLEDRCPTRVIVWPVPVQGEGSAAKIAEAIRGFGALAEGGPVPRPDLLIVARGGGSIEDLWAFNEEEVVRAAAESPIPLISAVGHETDTTLIDFASDRRAPTPTAAAEMAVPVRAELLGLLGELSHRQSACATRAAGRAAERLDQSVVRWPAPEAIFSPFAQRLDEVADRLPRGLTQRTAHARADLAEIAPRLQARLLTDRVERAGERLAGLWRLAELAHPERPLSRGFVRVTDRGGKTLVHAAAARDVGAIDLHFADGVVAAQVGDGSGPVSFQKAKRVERKRASPYPQPGLFDEG
ncbi:exodeoxyribonuclease VII large subunit [Sphingomonas sp. LY29]|uniref:exodeoxyribonuclease VII large subunit n=1 Tax=Sphingomonas sp. LY29 TaxID=3095341 RepID=UPI002D7787A7|nr:exodeoxyribonuclease VII large subunit [Sphingomonas sp. LY29]WRP24705.1 exodeoxyribonuclease VII large subunit [Sphingomonas sp. LY29]